MTKHLFAVAASALTLLAAPAFAESHASGDAAAGEEAFNKQCSACHVVVNDAGETLAGKKSKTGPNLFGLPGRQLGALEGFKYGADIVAAGAEKGIIWDEAQFVGYVKDPTPYLREATGNDKARSKMSFKVRKDEDALNIYAFLASVSPVPTN